MELTMENLNFSARTSTCLRKAGILTVTELTKNSVKELMKIKNFGERSVKEVKEKLNIFSLQLSEKKILVSFEEFENLKLEVASLKNKLKDNKKIICEQISKNNNLKLLLKNEKIESKILQEENLKQKKVLRLAISEDNYFLEKFFNRLTPFFSNYIIDINNNIKTKRQFFDISPYGSTHDEKEEIIKYNKIIDNFLERLTPLIVNHIKKIADDVEIIQPIILKRLKDSVIKSIKEDLSTLQ